MLCRSKGAFVATTEEFLTFESVETLTALARGTSVAIAQGDTNLKRKTNAKEKILDQLGKR